MRKSDIKNIDNVLRDSIKWHRSKEAVQATGFTALDRRLFISGLEYARILVKKAGLLLIEEQTS